MQIKVLGCSGGIGGDLRTTALLIDDDILIDAGTGVGDLSVEELTRIDHVFVTHSHLDHVTMIPFLVDTVCALRTSPIIVYGTAEVLTILKDHIFNWKIWPDFSVIPSAEQPFMRFREIQVGQDVKLGSRVVKAIPATHVVPAVGYLLDSGENSLIFSGDTTYNDALWDEANRARSLKYLIIETAFPNKERELAVMSKHLSPSMLAEELQKLHRPVDILVTHLKPGEIHLTMSEIGRNAGKWRPRMLENGMVLTI